eukprot:CAMPEP_0172186132 /NCGR_PEP_ID=MMETSP1050-20130122/20575_1 /TAXON_ID=233186 /ORGANISM="Cryptomonas curvata, Strain CCAP979/52" /LENGTH=450 /DNA_ID=CAMNT_0012860235 /DNA_START=302 /DNA_END=1649 /DNA_ORIENTATION=+
MPVSLPEMVLSDEWNGSGATATTTGAKATRCDRGASFVSINAPVSLPEIPLYEDWNANGATSNRSEDDHRSDSPCSVSSRSTRSSNKDDASAQDELAVLKIMNSHKYVPELPRWDSVANFNQPSFFECGAQSAASDFHCASTDSAQVSTHGADNYFCNLERRDSMYFPASNFPKVPDSNASFTFPVMERKDSFPVSHSMKSADQANFTVFELPSNSDLGFYEASGVKATRFDRRDSLISNNMPVSLPEIAHSDEWNGGRETTAQAEDEHHSDSSCSVSSRSTGASSKDDSYMPEELAVLKEGSFHMTRVDWRWAAMKGFWDKDKKCWIESAGGQAAYILQRMKRVKVREQRLARQAKAMQRLVPVQNLPFRSGLIEELPYQLDNDPWTVGLTRTAQHSQPSSAAPSMSWFDCKPDLAPPTAHCGAPPAQGAATVHVFPFSQATRPDAPAA